MLLLGQQPPEREGRCGSTIGPTFKFTPGLHPLPPSGNHGLDSGNIRATRKGE